MHPFLANIIQMSPWEKLLRRLMERQNNQRQNNLDNSTLSSTAKNYYALGAILGTLVDISNRENANRENVRKNIQDLMPTYREVSSAVRNEDIAAAAYNSFVLGISLGEIVSKSGDTESILNSNEKLDSLIERMVRNDALAVELDEIERELKDEGRTPSASVIWKKLRERCGREGSCCVTETTHNDKAAILWIGFQGNQESLTFRALSERLRRKKTRQGHDRPR